MAAEVECHVSLSPARRRGEERGGRTEVGWWCRRAAESVESEMKGLREVRVEREREGEREWGGRGHRSREIGRPCGKYWEGLCSWTLLSPAFLQKF